MLFPRLTSSSGLDSLAIVGRRQKVLVSFYCRKEGEAEMGEKFAANIQQMSQHEARPRVVENAKVKLPFFFFFLLICNICEDELRR